MEMRETSKPNIALFASERVGGLGALPQEGVKPLHPTNKPLFDLKNAIPGTLVRL
jgi:hypothetical protein